MERVDDLVAWLATTGGAGVDDAVRIDRIAALERAKGALAAAQVRQTVAFADSQRAAMPSWTPERLAARSIGSQVALARRESPTRGDAHLALARALTTSLPKALAALTAGEITEGAAEGLHRAIEDLAPALRREVDARLATDFGRLGERSLADAARRVASAVDDDASSRRVERAAVSRRVTLRTAADGMAYLTLLAPMAEATGAFRAVEAEATAQLGEPHVRSAGKSRSAAFWLHDAQAAGGCRADATSTGDAGPAATGGATGSSTQPASTDLVRRGSSAGQRTRSQMMADVVVSRLTGRAIGQPVPIEIQLVMTDDALRGETESEHEPACRRTPSESEHRGPQGRSADPSGPTEAGRPDEAYPSPKDVRPNREDNASPTLRPAEDGDSALGCGPSEADDVPDADHLSDSGLAEPVGRSERMDAGPAARAHSPAKVVGAGWLPASFARDLVRRTARAGSEVTLRRVVVGPDGATVVGLEVRRHRLTDPLGHPEGPSASPLGDPTRDAEASAALAGFLARAEEVYRPGPIPVLAPTFSTQRLFRGVLRRLVAVRDQVCRTPFCEAAIRVIDHVTPVRRDGPTCSLNAEGTCDRCNLTKEAPGWIVGVLNPPSRGRPDASDPPWQQLMDILLADDEPPDAEPAVGHRTAVITPTGHVYESAAPPATDRGRSASG
ncbi:MAG: DUF222 domain-containing protein [Nostocoides sp.]